MRIDLPRALVGGVALVAIVAVWALLSPGDAGGPEPRRGRPPASRDAGPRSPGATDPEESDAGSAADTPAEAGADPLSDLAAALERGDAEAARAAAAALRRALRLDEEARREAAARLLDGGLDPSVRSALALVLGTIDRPDVDPLLRDALARAGDDVELTRCLLLALGATREPEEDDDVFGLGDRPWGAFGPGGIGITVNRRIPDAATRAAATAFLTRDEPALREAAATALRHSTDAAGVREAFLSALAVEANDDVAPVLGESLAERASRIVDAATRRRIVEALLDRAGDEGLDAYRFRLENDFQGLEIDADAAAALRELAAVGRPFGTRSFALTALAAAARRSDPAILTDARDLLERLATGDRDDAVRDHATRVIATLPLGETTAGALARIAREDPAWNVRFTALESLARAVPPREARAAIRAARDDPDERVAARAAELLKTLD